MTLDAANSQVSEGLLAHDTLVQNRRSRDSLPPYWRDTYFMASGRVHAGRRWRQTPGPSSTVFVVRDEVFIRIRIHLTILRGFRRVGVCTVI